MTFRNIYGQEFTLEEMTTDIQNYIGGDEDYTYSLIVGSDSLYKASSTVFVTAVIIHRVGCGAKFYYTKRKIGHDIDICTRILEETYDSIKIMQQIERTDIAYLVSNCSIHIDAGENGDSRKILKECIAYVHGFGYECHTKPNACVASHVADRFTK